MGPFTDNFLATGKNATLTDVTAISWLKKSEEEDEHCRFLTVSGLPL